MGYLDDSRFDYTMCCSAKLIHSYLRSGIYELPILQSDKPERSVKKQSSFYAKVIQLYTSVYCMGLLPKHISPPSDPNIEHWEYYDELSKISGGEI
jgi:energy-converting hydrogenase Eha subunit A